MAILIPTVNILVPLDVDHLQLERGTPVDSDQIPAGSLQRMLDLGQLVADVDFVPDAADAESGESGDGGKPGAWQNLPVTVLDAPDAAKKALVEAGLTTVGQVIEFGDANDGLTSLSGIGDSSEAAVLKAISALAAAEE